MNIDNRGDINKSSSIKILRIIGSPFDPSNYIPRNEAEAERLYEIAVKNRIGHLYLEAIKGKEDYRNLMSEYERLSRLYVRLINSVGKISKLLEKLEVENFIFKTVRPYLAPTADIDLVILGRNYKQSVNSMLRSGYKLEENAYGPQSATLRDPEWNIKLDVYDEIAASYMIYLDKEKIKQYVKTDKIKNGALFQTLGPQADLVAIIGHSVIKEQMYCFGEYYTFLWYLASMKEDEIRQFIALVKKTRLTNAAVAYIGVTAILHQETHGYIPKICQQLMDELGTDFFEASRMTKNHFYQPHKYHILTVFRTLTELLGGSKFKRSVTVQFKALFNPIFIGQFVNELVLHFVRDTY